MSAVVRLELATNVDVPKWSCKKIPSIKSYVIPFYFGELLKLYAKFLSQNNGFTDAEDNYLNSASIIFRKLDKGHEDDFIIWLNPHWIYSECEYAVAEK